MPFGGYAYSWHSILMQALDFAALKKCSEVPFPKAVLPQVAERDLSKQEANHCI